MTTAAKFPTAVLALVDVGGEMPGFNAAVLSGAHNNSTATITLTATVPTPWPTAGWVTIDSEIIQYAGKSGATLTGCTRGAQSSYGNSVAASHSDQAQVFPALTPLAWNQLVADVIAHETFEKQNADIASAGTTDLSVAVSRYLHVTGTTTITSFGTVAAGRWFILKFDGILTLTHNASSLILRSGANATTAAGDVYAFVSEGSGNWREVWHLTPSSTSLSTATNNVAGDVTMTNANQYYDGPSVSLAAGTWLVVGTVTIYDATSTGGTSAAKLWDGTTVSASSEASHPGTGTIVNITTSAIVTPGSTTTYKISAACSQTGHTIRAATVTNGSGNNASNLRAIKVG